MPQRTLVALVIIKDREFVLFGKGDQLIFPGGEPKTGESDIEALEREFKEGASGAEIEVGKKYGTFMGVTPDGKALETIAHVARLKKPYSKLVPSGEVDKIYYLPYMNGKIIKQFFEKVDS